VTDPAGDLDRFYDLLGRLEGAIGGRRTLADCHGRLGWPLRGVYCFFEPGETRPDGSPRVTRVGTHALTTMSQAPTPAAATTGGRSSAATSARRCWPATATLRGRRRRGGGAAPPPGRWWWPNSRTRCRSAPTCGRCRLWLAVDDPPGRTSHRGVIERGAIGLLSRRINLLADPPSPGWLGQHALAPEIRTSGLWNVNHVDEPYDPVFLEVLEGQVAALAPIGR
jgi:hypothetical protein